jgi:hypothetical protein
VGLFHVWRHPLRGGAIFFLSGVFIPKPNNTRRKTGYFVHVAPSRTGGFWAIAKDEDGTPYFCYGKNFLNCPVAPRVGRTCEFSPLPAAMGKWGRATEIRVLPPAKPSPPSIIVEHFDGRAQVVLRDGKAPDKVLSELTF